MPEKWAILALCLVNYEEIGAVEALELTCDSVLEILEDEGVHLHEEKKDHVKDHSDMGGKDPRHLRL